MIDLIKDLSLIIDKPASEITEILNQIENLIIHKIIENKDNISENGMTFETNIHLISKIIVSKDNNILIKPDESITSKINSCIEYGVSPVEKDIIKKLNDSIIMRYYDGELLK